MSELKKRTQQTGLDGRMRIKNGRIREKNGSALISNLTHHYPTLGYERRCAATLSALEILLGVHSLDQSLRIADVERYQ